MAHQNQVIIELIARRAAHKSKYHSLIMVDEQLEVDKSEVDNEMIHMNEQNGYRKRKFQKLGAAAIDNIFVTKNSSCFSYDQRKIICR